MNQHFQIGECVYDDSSARTSTVVSFNPSDENPYVLRWYYNGDERYCSRKVDELSEWVDS